MLYRLASFLKKPDNEPYVSIDVGTSAIKVMSVDMSGSKPRLVSAGLVPTPAHALSNNAVVKPDQIAAAIRSLLDANDIKTTRASFVVPGSCAFTRKITIGHASLKELSANIAFEAGNYVPHSIDAVHLDYQVLRANGKSTIEVLLVAVKNEIVRSYFNAVEQAGLEPVIADVDYFALENMFELNYPEEKQRTVALINIGARSSSVSIIQNGESLFAGDVGVGGRLYTDALCESLGMQASEAEHAKMGTPVPGYDESVVNETRDRTTEHVASELHRQLGYFWNAAATDRSIEAVYVCGGSAQVPGFLEELSARTGMSCTLVNAFRNVDWSENFDEEFVGEIGLSMGVSVGLAIRRLGDKVHAIS